MLSVAKTLIFLINILYPLNAAVTFFHELPWHINGTIVRERGTLRVVGYIADDLILMGNTSGIRPSLNEIWNFFQYFNIPLQYRTLLFNGETIYSENPERIFTTGFLLGGENDIHQSALKWYLEIDEIHFPNEIRFCE